MYCFVLFLFVNLSLSVHSNLYTNNNYSIQMKLEKVFHRRNGTEDVQKKIKVLQNKSFNITLVNYVATRASCGIKGNNFQSEFIVADGHSTIKFSEAIKNMTGKWQCTIETKGSVLKLIFDLRVIGGPKEVKIEIAGRELNTSLSDSPELAYDELGIYQFKDGETVQLICKNNKGQEHPGGIYLRYYDSKDTILLETDKFTNYESTFFQRTMKPEDNNHAIECIYVTKNSNLMFPNRVIFKLINSSIDNDFTITINDLKLRQTEKNLTANENIAYYQFTYFRNQILTVSFETSNEQYDSIRFDCDFNSFKVIKTTPWKYTIKFHTKFIKNGHYKLCVTNGGVSNPFPIAEISLTESSFPELLITGLDAKDVIDQYRKNKTTWIIDYWYSVDEPLRLSCISQSERNLQWLFGTSVVHNEYGKNISHNFKLSEEYNETLIIVCEDLKKTQKNKRSIINLHRKPGYAVTTDYPYSSEKESDNTILIACAMVASILVVTTLGFVFYRCRYRTSKSLQTTTDTLETENQYSAPTYSTPMARNTEPNYTQGYMVQNSLYEPNTFDNGDAEYQYIVLKDIPKEKYATARPVSSQADNLYVNTLAKIQLNENNDKGNRTTAEVEFNPRYANIAKDEEYPQSRDNLEIYDYST